MARLRSTPPGAFRIGTWHGGHGVAMLGLGPGAPPPTGHLIAEVLATLRDSGYGHVVSAALRPHEARPFLDAGFTERERLVVLARPIHRNERIERSGEQHRTRRARHSDRSAVLHVDGLAFPPPWRLDGDGLDEAIRATPSTRFRVVDQHGVIGYAICGRAGRQGYLQRLAVSPEHQGRGVGGHLVIDAIDWLRRRRATRVLVNTQATNDVAIELYRSLGFEPDAPDLIVLERPL